MPDIKEIRHGEWYGAIDILPAIRKQIQTGQITQINTQKSQRVVIGKKKLDFNRRLKKALGK